MSNNAENHIDEARRLLRDGSLESVPYAQAEALTAIAISLNEIMKRTKVKVLEFSGTTVSLFSVEEDASE